MSIERRTVLDQIEIRRDGTVLVRLSKQVVENGNILVSDYHRCGMEPGTDFDTMCSVVNAHLVLIGDAAVSVAEWDRVRRVVRMEQTPNVVQAFAAARKAEQSK